MGVARRALAILPLATAATARDAGWRFLKECAKAEQATQACRPAAGAGVAGAGSPGAATPTLAVTALIPLSIEVVQTTEFFFCLSAQKSLNASLESLVVGCARNRWSRRR